MLRDNQHSGLPTKHRSCESRFEPNRRVILWVSCRSVANAFCNDVLLPVFLHGASDFRLCYSWYRAGIGYLEVNAGLGQCNSLVDLRHRPVNQWESGRPVRWPTTDESWRCDFVRAELGRQLWNWLREPDHPMGGQRVRTVYGLGSGKSRAIQLVASVGAGEDLRCLCFRSRVRFGTGVCDFDIDIGV